MTIEVTKSRRALIFLAGDTTAIYGTVTFGRNDADGPRLQQLFLVEKMDCFWKHPDGVFNPSDIFCVWKEKRSRIGTTTPNEALDVNGNDLSEQCLQQDL